MSRWIWAVCGIVILMGAHTLAQRTGGRGTRNPSNTNTAPNNDDLKDFNRALALQATAGQKTQFQELTKTAQSARKGAQDLQHLAENASKPDLLHFTQPFTSTVEEAQTDSGKFVQSFSAAQKSGLKAVTKKLGKANAEITKQSKALTQALERSRFDGKQIAGIAEKLDKALGDFQTEQTALGTEMGIQNEASAKGNAK